MKLHNKMRDLQVNNLATTTILVTLHNGDIQDLDNIRMFEPSIRFDLLHDLFQRFFSPTSSHS
jgi:hypothetical protein